MERGLDIYPGVIHKRSVVGILAGLRKVGLVDDKDGWVWPVWCEVGRREQGEQGEGGRRLRWISCRGGITCNSRRRRLE